MIKQCNVVMDNGLNMVVDFNGLQIQMPSTKKKDKTVFVKYENQKYSLANKESFQSNEKKFEKEFNKQKDKE